MDDAVESYLTELARTEHEDPVLVEMEARAAQHAFPIVGRATGRFLDCAWDAHGYLRSDGSETLPVSSASCSHRIVVASRQFAAEAKSALPTRWSLPAVRAAYDTESLHRGPTDSEVPPIVVRYALLV
jgi:hypothetical protein